MLFGVMACNMVNTPASMATVAPTPIVLASTSTPKPLATATPALTVLPPTQRPPVATAVPPATLPPQPQPDPNLCYFYPYGLNGSTITLYSGPGEINPLGATISATQFIVATAQAGNWIKVRSVANQEGWIQLERGSLGGNCAALPQQPGGQECRATANSDTTVLARPEYSAEPFQMVLVASGSVRVVARSNGFLGFDPGVNWIPADVTGTARLRWIAPGDTITLTGACDTLPIIPQAECRATANVDQTVYVLPDASSQPWGFSFLASASVVVTANNNGFYGFDPGINEIPASITGPARLRWIAPGNITLSGACNALPSVVIP